MARPRIRGIVLAGTYQWSESPFEDLQPRPLVPVALTPLIVYALRWLVEGGVSRATVCVNSAARAVRDYLNGRADLPLALDYLEDWLPRGTAGCVRDAGLGTDGDVFVIADGTAVPVGAVRGLLETHHVSRAALTILAHNDPDYRAFGATPLSPSGVYSCDRRVLELIPSAGFFDIKEGLIPQLHEAGERVVTHTGYGACPRAVNAESYLALNEWMTEWISQQPGRLPGYELRGQTVVHPSAVVDPGARVLGPVLIGPRVEVEAGATIVGPTTIGEGSQIRRGAVVARTVTWSDCRVEEDAVVDRCLLADGAVVPAGELLHSALEVRKPGKRGLVASLRRERRPRAPAEGRPASPPPGRA
jgi:NDP-sugar pyrophosphorylase family protein